MTALYSEYSICKDTGHQVGGLGDQSGQVWCLPVLVVSTEAKASKLLLSLVFSSP